MEKPNILIIIAEQLRRDVLGSPYTPNINKLKEESVVFERAYCTSPLCVPARGSFFTGKYPNETGCIINPWEPLEREYGEVKKGIPNLYLILEDEWDCWNIGKQHFISEERERAMKIRWITMKEYHEFLKKNGKKRPGGEAFRSYCPEMTLGKITRRKRYSIPYTAPYEEGFEYFSDTYILKKSLSAIKNRDEERPLFLCVNFQAVHPPYNIPEPYYSMVKDVELPENVGRWSEDQSPLQLYNLPGFLGSRYTREDWKKIWPVYVGYVALLDYCVGQILSEFKKEGLYKDSLVIFTADHGEMLGSHCMWQKMCMYEEATHVPLYIKLPGKEKAAKNISTLVSHVDVFPTILDHLGIKTSTECSGISLKPLMRGETVNRDAVFIQFDGNGARGNFQRCVVKDNYKLIVDMFKDEIYFELYDVVNDPQELKNLAFEEKEKTRELFLLIREYMKDTNDLLRIPENAYERFLEDYSKFRSQL